MAHVVTVPELLDGHVVLDIECLDRVYLNGYVPSLQAGGQVVGFLHDHLGTKIASPAVFEQIGTRFRRAVARFAGNNDIPMVKFTKDMRKIDVMRPLLDQAARAGRSRVVAIGWAQEFQHVWEARKRTTDPSRLPQFSFAIAERRVTCYYFYLWDEISAGRSSRSARTSPTRLRSGSTGTSGPSGSWPGPGSGSPRCPTGSLPARIRRRCRTSATGSGPARSWCSSSGGCPGSRCR